MNRCHWTGFNNPLYVTYHDQEWGKASHDDHYLFEMLLLESFQAGLSWECILNKREDFRKAFDLFDVHKIASYGPSKVEELMNNPKIVRNRRKIESSILNAKIFLKIQKEFGSFDSYIWSFTKGKVIRHTSRKMIVSSPLSDKISRDLQKRGMKFVGTVIIYSYLQAVGIVNDHEKDCDFS